MTSPRIAREDWLNHISCSEFHGALIQRVDGTSHFNALVLPEDHQRRLRRLIEHRGACPYCNEPLTDELNRQFGGLTGGGLSFVTCSLCGFWRHAIWDGVMGTTWTIPYARGFQPQEQAVALGELARELRDSPQRIYDLHPAKFETLVGGILKDFFDCEVMHVGRTGDGGIDLLVLDADAPLVVQVKRRTRADATEGLEVVKHLFASLFVTGSRRGMVVTSAQRFTRGAKAWVRLPALRDSGYELELVDINRLMDITRRVSTSPVPAWQRFLDYWDKRVYAVSNQPVSPELWSTATLADEFVVTPPGPSGVGYAFVRADRDCCTVRTDAGASPVPPRTLGGIDFAELLVGWPKSVMDRLFDFWAGAGGEMLVPWDP